MCSSDNHYTKQVTNNSNNIVTNNSNSSNQDQLIAAVLPADKRSKLNAYKMFFELQDVMETSYVQLMYFVHCAHVRIQNRFSSRVKNSGTYPNKLSLSLLKLNSSLCMPDEIREKY